MSSFFFHFQFADNGLHRDILIFVFLYDCIQKYAFLDLFELWIMIIGIDLVNSLRRNEFTNVFYNPLRLYVAFQEVPTANHPPGSLCISFLATSMNLLFGLLLSLLPWSSILTILLPIQSLSLLCTISNHLNLTPLALSPKHPTSCPSDVLVLHPVNRHHSQRKSQHL